MDCNTNPFAVILTCSDSRVVPELIFDAGIGGKQPLAEVKEGRSNGGIMENADGLFGGIGQLMDRASGLVGDNIDKIMDRVGELVGNGAGGIMEIANKMVGDNSGKIMDKAGDFVKDIIGKIMP